MIDKIIKGITQQIDMPYKSLIIIFIISLNYKLQNINIR